MAGWGLWCLPVGMRHIFGLLTLLYIYVRAVSDHGCILTPGVIIMGLTNVAFYNSIFFKCLYWIMHLFNLLQIDYILFNCKTFFVLNTSI